MPRKPARQKLATMNISMPANLRARVDEKIRSEGFGNASEYFRSLIRTDLRYGGVGTLDHLLLDRWRECVCDVGCGAIVQRVAFGDDERDRPAREG